LLVFFARHPGEVLSRDELIDNVWTRNVVTSHVVTQSISELRKSLKDGNDSSPEYIATVPKRGYKLTVPVIWCTEEGEEPAMAIPSALPVATPELTTLALSVAGVEQGQAPVVKPEKRRRITTFWVWVLFL
ncbi:transcriptional regulator, partial [Escherichia coli]|nr:transcriptional regulator [Escherichia coli]